MTHRRLRIRSLLSLAGAAVVLCALPALVSAGGGPTLEISAVSPASSDVAFSSRYETGTAAVALMVDGSEATRAAVPPSASGHVLLQAAMPASATAEAVALDSSDRVLGVSAPISFHGSDYAPAAVALDVKPNQIVRPTYEFVIAAPSSVTTATLYIGGIATWRGAVTVVDGIAKLPPTAVRYGRSTVRVVAENSWGSVSSATIPVYQLGKSLPSLWRWVLVDKSDYYLYYAEGGVIKARYPVAIGMPGTPTPSGSFRRWYPQPGGGVWGVIRMNLQRRVRGGFVRTSYYIHGTNDPDSIGTMASHGCVRMYNRDVLRLAAALRKYSKRPMAYIRN